MSESVKVLEARVGEPLLERSRTAVVPTARGLELAEDARQIVAARDRALDIAARLATARDGLGVVVCLRDSIASDLARGTLTEVWPGQVGPGMVHAVIGSPHRRPPRKTCAVATYLARGLPDATLAPLPAQA